MLLSVEPWDDVFGIGQEGLSDAASAFHQASLNLAKTIQLTTVSDLLDRCNVIHVIATLRIRFDRSKSHFLQHKILLGMLEIAGNLPQQTPPPVLRLLLLALKEAFCCCSCFTGIVIDALHLITKHLENSSALADSNLKCSTAVVEDLVAELLIVIASITSWHMSSEEDNQDFVFNYLREFKPCRMNSTLGEDQKQRCVDKVCACLRIIVNAGVRFVCPTILHRRTQRVLPGFIVMSPSEHINGAIKVILQAKQRSYFDDIPYL